MGNIAKVRQKQEREFEPKWVKVEIDEGEVFEVQCAFGAKPEFQRAVDVVTERFRREHGIAATKELSQAQSDECFWEAAVGVVIFDWRGLDDDGQPVEFSLANILRYCLQNRPTYLYRMRSLLLRTVTDANAHGQVEEAAVEGNSETRQSGEGGGPRSPKKAAKSSSPASTPKP